MTLANAPVPTALFLDFDNVFTSLFQRRIDAAESFVSDPLAWIHWLERRTDDGSAATAVERRILIRRCYLNPMATISLSSGKRIQFSGFRRAFVRAGFQVVDCPPLTNAGKTSADMVMAMDILDTLAHPTRFGEFVIISSDADFTPVLLRVRAFDRIGTIIALGNSAGAYRAAADRVIGHAEFLRNGLKVPTVSGVVVPDNSHDGFRDRLIAYCTDRVKAAGGRMNMAMLAGELGTTFGREEIKESAWGGAGTFRAIVAAAGLERDGDTVRLRPAGAPAPDGPTNDDIAAADPIRRIGKSVNYFPRIAAEALAAIFAGILDNGGTAPSLLDSDFREALAQKLRAEGHAVSRGVVGMVVHRLRWGGLTVDPAPAGMTAAMLREAFHKGLVAEGAHRVVFETDADRDTISAWVHGDVPSASTAGEAPAVSTEGSIQPRFADTSDAEEAFFGLGFKGDA